ncbi:MAG: MFS transporter [Bacteroidales bacterium]|jgi:MFS family permease|nr:MFS transporter [Bacteroidales bacterium]
MYSKRTVFWSACLGMLLFGIGLITLGAILPDLKEKYSLDAVAAGTLFSILPLGVLAGSLLFGPLCDRFGYKPLMTTAAVMMFAGFQGLAFSPSTGILNIFIFLIGLGGGALNGATSALVSDISTSGKGADLSLLGMFFGFGALGMPILLGVLEKAFKFDVIVSLTGFIALAAAILFLVIKYPPAKLSGGASARQMLALFRDETLLLIAFFLFFQSAFEALVNNWTTTYLIDRFSVQQSSALMGLSAYVAGMTIMRLMIGSIFRNVPEKRLLVISFGILIIALITIVTGKTLFQSAAGLLILGAGLAGGFPIMLGFVGNRYPNLSGTAFSLAFTIALLGNMLINFSMGLIVEKFGVKTLPAVQSVELIVMITLGLIVFKKLKTSKPVI